MPTTEKLYKMKRLFFILSVTTFCLMAGFSQEVKWYGPSVDFSHGKLVVSDNGRYLQFEDGSGFMYIGDTGWELFHRLNREEAEKYLEKRREQGFTVIQAVVLAEFDGLDAPNAYGKKPLIKNDPLKPNEKYFEHVDYIVKLAAKKGLFIGMLPTWGDKVDPQWGKGPMIFNAENAYDYGEWIGRRYKNDPNIIWINGGDRWCGDKNYPVFDALGKGIKSVDPNHLMTFHPQGGISSSYEPHIECSAGLGCVDGLVVGSGRSVRIPEVLIEELSGCGGRRDHEGLDDHPIPGPALGSVDGYGPHPGTGELHGEHSLHEGGRGFIRLIGERLTRYGCVLG